MKNKIVLCLMAIIGMLGGAKCNAQASVSHGNNKELIITQNGATDYVIVQPESPTGVDKFAVKELAQFLMAATGVDFKIVTISEAAKYDRKIFVGIGPANTSRDLEGMEDQDSVCESSGSNVYLYGKGIHGNLYAVYDFLEGTVGYRWFSAFAKPYIPKNDQLIITPFKKKVHLDFKYRDMYSDPFFLRPEALLFLYRNKLNMGLESKMPKGSGVEDQLKYIYPRTHTFFCYLPPRETPLQGRGINPPLKSLKNKNYFTTNPEFFSMDANGKRVEALQLCFANKELRKELTANIEANIQVQGGKGIVDLTCNDIPGRLCYCPDCVKIEEDLGCSGGPLFDYLIELCGYLKEKYPEVMVRTFAYRKDQSQKPPKVEKLPGNLLIIFVPVDDNVTQDWNHPSNTETRHDLERWCKICQNVWVWYYISYEYIPFCNTQRLVNDIRLMKKLGVQGLFLQVTTPTLDQGFTELQTYMMLKLSQSTEQESEALIYEFMNFQYGKAASAMRHYHNDLEECRKDIQDFVLYSAPIALFRYLTAGNLFRWEQNFDEMEQLTKDDPAKRNNVLATRLPLDLAVLQNWQKVKKEHPDYFKNAKHFEERVRSTYDRLLKDHVSPSLAPNGQNLRKNFYDGLDAIMIFAENPGKPLSAKFIGIPEDMIKRAVPGRKRIKDADAAFGITAVSVSGMPFKFGFYDTCGKKFVLERAIQASEIKADAYELYKLGTVVLTPDCKVWLSDWNVTANLANFYEPGSADKWDIYVSLKFEGPSYSKDSGVKEDRVLCDQIVLIKVSEQK